MLWLRGWHETRWRVLWCIVMFAIELALEYLRGVKTGSDVRIMLDNLLLLWIFFPLILSGDGVHSPSGLRTSRGLHGSASFTLGLPVTRFRLLAARAILGMFEIAGVIAMVVAAIWILFPIVRETAMPRDAAAYFAVVTAAASAFYSLSILLAVIMDAIWKLWFSFGLLIVARVAMARLHFPPALDCFRAITSSSPLLTGSASWYAVSLSVTTAAVFFAMASKIAEERDYA